MRILSLAWCWAGLSTLLAGGVTTHNRRSKGVVHLLGSGDSSAAPVETEKINNREAKWQKGDSRPGRVQVPMEFLALFSAGW